MTPGRIPISSLTKEGAGKALALPWRSSFTTLMLATLPVFSQTNTGQWISKGSPIQGLGSRGEIGGAVVRDKVYFLGGIGGPTGGYKGLNEWKTIAPIPHSTAAGGVAAVGGRLYVIGGVDTNGIVLNLVQEYNPVTDTWNELGERARMPTAREHIGVAVLDSLIYVVAGRLKGRGDSSVKNFEVYSPARNAWDSLPRLPTARSDLGFVAARGKLYAMGGEWPGMSDVNEEYDPIKKTWRSVAKMLAPRHGFVALNVRDSLYAIGARNTVEAVLPPPPSVRILHPKSKEAGAMRIEVGPADALGRLFPWVTSTPVWRTP